MAGMEPRTKGRLARVTDLTPTMIQAWMDDMAATDLALSMMRVRQSVVSSFCTWMSRRGNCYDNAAMESWFSTLKSELGARFETYGHAKELLFDYIEVFYNQERRHSA